ncbi:MAG: DNA-directed polymerase subunit beta', DNA-directed polymerase subunit beta' [Candidatus Berkelbacteria bacterium]|nr:DNA-directed polymerase subunit beta', DNA-directed polymerase subunit beta' [Candidatus Berkelbacteria bacterium]
MPKTFNRTINRTMQERKSTYGAKSTEAKILDFDALKISVASPDDIGRWSHGEVLKPETINYRTQKPERDGLFDERIFGPVKDYECYCGKYKKIRYKGVICDKCGVEVTRSAVRRERMGHIDLSVPIAHIWYVHGVPSVLGLVMDLSTTDLERVIYFAGFIILEVDETIRKSTLEQLEKEYQDAKGKYSHNNMEMAKVETAYRATKQELNNINKKQILTESKYQDLSLRYGQIVKVGIGAEAIYETLKKMDLGQLYDELNEELKKSAPANRRRILRRLRLITDMRNAGIKPEWLILSRLPVIPPDLRPMVQLDGGRYAASDLNDLYRRVINRNNRLKRLISQGAPEVICRNEKRMLQEAVDSLIDNSARRGRAVSTGSTQRKLRSLSDMLRGKQGRFRQNLLGKRVDYSGRSVIVIGPDLKLHQCGIPKVMALELFKPFVISRLIADGHVHNVKNATRIIEKGEPIVWDILEKITSNYYVLLNRAPTLHRLGIQGFQPVLIEGKAIQVHPLVCYAFNADFDGDQMAVHVPLSEQAKEETVTLMRASKNILKPASGEPVVSPRLDIVFGCYYLTSFQVEAKGEGKVFASKNEAILAYHQGYIHVRAKIKIKMRQTKSEDIPEELVETSVGRILFNNILPDEVSFQNNDMDSKALKKLITMVFDKFGIAVVAEVVDNIKKIGFEHAGLSGMTISASDIIIPSNKNDFLKVGDKKLEEIDNQYQRGLITDYERNIKTIELWNGIRSQLEGEMLKEFNRNNPVYIMIASGARGSVAQLTQMGGMKGLVVNPSGEIIELPIRSNYKEGLSVIEYFISTHGARKGKSDTALRTSDAGYLTRRLVDVAHDLVITTKDCGSTYAYEINRRESEEMGEDFTKRLVGRNAFEEIKIGKEIIVRKTGEISESAAEKITNEESIARVLVRSVLGCRAERGTCVACYGRDLSSGKQVESGTVVGIMAAQAIGEPGTQLTMKTFHMGGITGEDITSGLPRVEELFEARPPRSPAVLAEIDGKVKIVEEKDKRSVILTSNDYNKMEYELPKGYKAVAKSGDLVKNGQAIAIAPEKKAIRADIKGKVTISDKKISVVSTEKLSINYPVGLRTTIKVEDNAQVTRGQELTEGHFDLDQSLKLKGELDTQKYIIRGIQEIYASQGQTINDKHIEIIIRGMFSKVKIKDAGDSNYLSGQIVDRLNLTFLNESLRAKNQKPVTFDLQVMGITRIALKTASFLSAASFQETTSVLIDAATQGKIDYLQGLKENVIIGKLIPAGTALGRK